MDLGLRDKVALVTGSSRGLGRAVAEELAAEGASLVLCARGETQLSRTLDDISQRYQARVVAVPADLSEPKAVQQLVSTARREMGRVDILVTNAGGPPAGGFSDLTPEMWQEGIELTLKSVLNLVRGVLPDMRKQRWGRIINITSVAVKQPIDNLILSNSLRAAVTGLARSLANEVARLNITVNNVMPGYTQTQRLEELADQIARRERVERRDVFQGWERDIPMGRLGEPRELAALVAFLASERASYITGGSMAVDGGLVRSLL